MVETMKLTQLKFVIAGDSKGRHYLPLPSPLSSRAILAADDLVDHLVRVALVVMEGSFI